MFHVPRIGPGTKHRGTLALRKIVIYFQKFPGTHSASGIGNVDFVFNIAGRVAQRGKTAADGRIDLQLPAGSSAILEIFGSKFNIRVRNTLEPLTDLHGVQRRASMLGYELGAIDGILGAKMDRSILNFLADENLATDGLIDAKTTNKLKSKVGE